MSYGTNNDNKKNIAGMATLLNTISTFIKTLFDDADSATARATLGAAPAPTASAGAGQWVGLIGTGDAKLYLAAGGTWGYALFVYASTTGVISYPQPTSGNFANVKAGGAQIANAISGYTPFALVYHITVSPPSLIDFARPIYIRHGMFQGDTGGPDTYIVTLGKDPYHAIPGHATFDRIQQYLAEHLEITPLEEPAPVFAPMDPEMLLAGEIMADYIKAQKATKKWQDRKAALIAEAKMKAE